MSQILRIVVWSLAGLAGLVVLLGIALGVTAATLPGCAQCHSSSTFVSASKATKHGDIACTRCHVEAGVASRTEYAYHMIFGMALRLEPVNTGPVASVADSTCLSCHQEVMQKTVQSNGFAIQHSTCAKGRMCTDCHSQTAHGAEVKWQRTSQMNECLDCHSTSAVRTNCDKCHKGRTPQERVTTGEWKITHGPNWKQTHGMGTLTTCASCHASDFCVRCHQIPLPHSADFVRLHPLSALTKRSACSVCHQQAFCDSCHQLPMPHPVDFTPSHPKFVQANGSTLCLRCHVSDDCSNCHIRHVHPGGALLPPKSGL